MAKKKIEIGTAKSVPKKEVKKKVVPVKKPNVFKHAFKTTVESTVELLSYSMKAVIPTQQYGNVQPEIIVKAPTIEEARKFIEPIMEEIYQKYAEATPDGRTPKFFKKPEVQVVEKIVTTPAGIGIGPTVNPTPAVTETPITRAQEGWAPAPPTPAWQKEETANVPFDDTHAPDPLNSPQYLKGVGMIEGAMTNDALNLIEPRVKDSVKLNPQEKSALLELVLKKRLTFNK